MIVHKTLIRIFAFFGIFSTSLLVRSIVWAQERDYYTLSENLPLIGSGGISVDLTEFFNNLLGISVGLAAGLAVLMLSVGGFKYMTSESMFGLGSAKEQITNAVVGLLIVLCAVMVLSFINPELTGLRFFAND